MLSKINFFGRVNERDGYTVLRNYEQYLIAIRVERDGAYRHITFEDETGNRLVWVTTNTMSKERLFNKTRKYAFRIKELRGGPADLASPRIVIDHVREVTESGRLNGYDVGTRINVGVTCVANTMLPGQHTHIEIRFEDADKTTFVWRTTKKQGTLYTVGETYTVGMRLSRIENDTLCVQQVRIR